MGRAEKPQVCRSEHQSRMGSSQSTGGEGGGRQDKTTPQWWGAHSPLLGKTQLYMQGSSAGVLLPPTGPCPLPAQNHLKTQDHGFLSNPLSYYASPPSLRSNHMASLAVPGALGTVSPTRVSAWDSLAAVALCLRSLSSLQTPARCKPPLLLALHTCARL